MRQVKFIIKSLYIFYTFVKWHKWRVKTVYKNIRNAGGYGKCVDIVIETKNTIILNHILKKKTLLDKSGIRTKITLKIYKWEHFSKRY